MLVALIEAPNRELSRSQLIAAGWGERAAKEGAVLSNTVQAGMTKLRTVLPKQWIEAGVASGDDDYATYRYVGECQESVELPDTRGQKFPVQEKQVTAETSPAIPRPEPVGQVELEAEVRAYLLELLDRLSTLPAYYPERMQLAAGKTLFDKIRQTVQLADREEFEKWAAEERERTLVADLVNNRLAYQPFRSRPENEGEQNSRRGENEVGKLHEMPRPAPRPIQWDEHAGRLFRRAMILGDPGFGKTWLLQYETRRLAHEAVQGLDERTVDLEQLILPIFFRLSDLANRGKDDINKALLDLVKGKRSDAFCLWVQGKLETEHCAILLDAWDEVPTEIPGDGQPIAYERGRRQWLGQRLAEFARMFPRPRLLLTSRMAGYTASPIHGMLELELLAFELPQQEQFVRVWFEDEEAKDVSNKETTGTAFLQLLREKYQVRGLARIPLLLALMCRAYESNQLQFPARRSEVYRCCIWGLLRDWKRGKEERQISDAYVHHLLQLLENVAFEIFRDGYQQFGEALLEDKVAPWLDGLKPSHALYSKKAIDVIGELKTEGILTELGGSNLIFINRTFQEYLAAGGLLQLLRKNQREGWRCVDKKAWDPVWESVIVCFAARLANISVSKNASSENDRNWAGRHLRRLLGLLANARKDDYLRHRLALSARCLLEVIPEVRIQLLHEMQQIVGEATSTYSWFARRELTMAIPHLTRTLPHLVEFELQESRLWLTSKAGNPPRMFDERRQMAIMIARELGSAAMSPPVVQALRDLLASDDVLDRALAARSLGFLGSAAPFDTLAAVLDRLRDDNPLVRRTAAEATGVMGSAASSEVRSEIIQALVMLFSDESPEVGIAAAEALASLGIEALQPDIVAVVLEFLRNTWTHTAGANPGMAVWALGFVGSAANAEGRAKSIHLLTQVVEQDSKDLRGGGTAALGRLSAAASSVERSEIVHIVMRLLSDDDFSVRMSVAETLGRLGSTASTELRIEIMPAIMQLFSDRDIIVRTAAAEAMTSLGPEVVRPDVILAMLKVLQDNVSPAPGDFDRLARNLASLSNAIEAELRPQVVRALVQMTSDDGDEVRLVATQTLSHLHNGPITADVVCALLERLVDKMSGVRGAAALALGNIGRHLGTDLRAQILDALVQRLYAFPDEIKAVDGLISLCGTEAAPAVLCALGSWMSTPNELGYYYYPFACAFTNLGNTYRLFRGRNRKWRIETIAELSRCLAAWP
jgi:HEAT repeat protein